MITAETERMTNGDSFIFTIASEEMEYIRKLGAIRMMPKTVHILQPTSCMQTED